jgi:septal ring factor EnvC (AmiA/AmiB activator)
MMFLKARLFLFLGILFCVDSAGALTTQNEVLAEPLLSVQLERQQELLTQIDLRIEDHKRQLRSKTEAYYQIQQRPLEGPLHLWQQNDASKAKTKDLALKVLGLSVREGVRELELMEGRRLEAQAELEWLRIQEEEFSKSQFSAAQSLNQTEFKCRILPVESESKIELIQGYGLQKDLETGIEWNSMGWWLSAIHSDVRACDSGRVVFVGEISGRGRVVMLDHGSGHLTVYANLNPAILRTLQKGQRLEVGTVLGQSLDRVYFEYRSHGIASDPRKALRRELISQIAL